MSGSFPVINRNAAYFNAKNKYPNMWMTQPRPTPMRQPAPAAQPQPEPDNTKIVLAQLAKKTKKEVREWFQEQIEALDDSSSTD